MSQPNGGTFDIVILGAGSGGYAAALRAAQLDLSVALIEKDKLGGTCLHRGCIPTKALLHAGEVADQTRESEQFGVKAELIGIDMAGRQRVQGRRGRPAVQGPAGPAQAAEDHRRRRARASSSRRTPSRSTAQRYTGRNVILATGSYSRSLPGLEVDGKRVITSEHALTLDRVPASAIVLGGGVIGVEFASVWKSFGVDVTIVEALPRLVAAEDEEISKAVERAFRKRKINFKVGKPFEKVEHTENGVQATIAGGETVEAELLLVAVGRGPTTADLGYEEQGVTLDRGFVHHRRAAAHRRRQHLRRRRHRARPAARPPRLPAGHLRRRGDRRPEPGRHRRGRHPAGHLLRPGGRLGRPDRGQGQGAVRRRQGHDVQLQPRRQRQEPDPQDRRASSSWSGSRTARSSACTWSAPGSAS